MMRYRDCSACEQSQYLFDQQDPGWNGVDCGELDGNLGDGGKEEKVKKWVHLGTGVGCW